MVGAVVATWSFVGRRQSRMLARSRGWVTMAVLCLAPLPLWVLAHPLAERFATPAGALKSLANIAALVGTAAFAVALTLGGRLRVVERLFVGLDRMYRAHRFLGLVAVSLVALHVLLLVLSRALLPGRSPWTLFTPGAGWKIFVGVVALPGLLAGLALTMFARMRHETFVRVQRSIAIVFLLASVHVFVVPGTKASSRPLTVYLALLTGLALAAFARRSLLGRLLIRRRRYRVEGVQRLAEDTVEIVLSREGDRLRFQPGQFVFVRNLLPSRARQPAAGLDRRRDRHHAVPQHGQESRRRRPRDRPVLLHAGGRGGPLPGRAVRDGRPESRTPCHSHEGCPPGPRERRRHRGGEPESLRERKS
jgi:hypothetical protein